MATEEPTNPPAPSAPLILPHYPEIILAAIEAIDDKNGANKSTISRHIEATYGDIPAAHTTLLSHHLNKMKASGQLIVVKNNYLKPENAPPRRGRGRPPKSKEPLPPGTVLTPARSRGRPPKPRDPLAPVPSPMKAAPSESGRKRGRPAKSGSFLTRPLPAASGEKRGRGRPPKVKAPVATPIGA